MKRDLRNSRHSGHRTGQSGGQPVHNPDEGFTAQQAKLWQSLQGKSQQELQEAFYQTAHEQMKQGTFNEAAIMQMIDRMGPMITGEQKERMVQMLRSLHSGG